MPPLTPQAVLRSCLRHLRGKALRWKCLMIITCDHLRGGLIISRLYVCLDCGTPARERSREAAAALRSLPRWSRQENCAEDNRRLRYPSRPDPVRTASASRPSRMPSSLILTH
jgi:hypothetical protein